jgi:hypothetical protein
MAQWKEYRKLHSLVTWQRMMDRFQATCLTCPQRRFHFQGEKSGYKRYKKAVMVLESASGKGFILPKDYFTYGLIIDVNSHFYEVKKHLLKFLMTVAERIAEW